jgi:inorganic triphosphatase YgiF
LSQDKRQQKVGWAEARATLSWEVRAAQEKSASMSEVALTLAVKAGDLPQLKRALLDMAGPRPAEHTTVTSTYYDTTAGRLNREGLALRVQEQDGQYTQMVMMAGVKGRPPFADQEWEEVIDGGRQDLRSLNGRAHLPEVFSDPELRARFTTVVQRTLCMLEPDGSTQIAGTVEAGEIRTADGTRTEPICEVGLRLMRGDPSALYETGLRLLEIAPLRIEARSKVERGYWLLEDTTAKLQAQYFLSFGLKPGTTVEECLQKIGLDCLTLFLRNEPAALSDEPDGVHQMRVAVRRLRSMVATLRRMLPSQQYEWVSDELRWMANVLGPARNWDVFSGSLLAPVKNALLSEQDLDKLCRICEQERQSAHHKANAAIRSSQYTVALLKLSRWFTSCSWRNQPVSQQSALLVARIEDVAPNLIERRYKKAVKAAKRFDQLTLQQRHEFRISIKKLRYTIEFFRDLFDNHQVSEFVGRLKPLQDDMGYANDVRVAHELLAGVQISEDVDFARAAGVVLGWHNRGLTDLDRKLRKHVRRFRQVRPFW